MVGLILMALALGLLLLLIPDRQPPALDGGGKIPFVWDRDDLWKHLEQRFVATRQQGCDDAADEISTALSAIDAHLDVLQSSSPDSPLPRPGDSALTVLESDLFSLAPLVAACPQHAADFMTRAQRLRITVKGLSWQWRGTLSGEQIRQARNQVYRLLYGSRAAVEEVLLQLPQGEAPDLTRGIDEPSATPSTVVRGVRVHSGDLLVSRGGAPTSALIARGNDYPGNFSHIAMLHVDDATSKITIIESHIEKGAILASLDEYLKGTMLRIMVLRPRADLPALVADPSLPHRVATRAMEEVRSRHIPYDFELDYQDPDKQFCAEVASSFYADFGVELWEGLTSMSSQGVTRWLAALGVRHFETHGPSDLEYDPQLRVVAEWRDPETLFRAHVDNAIIDILLQGAEAGDNMEHSWPMLPAARLAKGYSVMMNLVGRLGPIPEGMNATVALRVRWLGQRHAALKARTLELAEQFKKEKGYTAPYWELVNSARQAKSE